MNILPVISSAFEVTSGGFTLVAELVSAEGTDILGYYPALSLGSLTPTLYGDATISSLNTSNLTGIPTYATGIQMSGNRAQDFFTSITANSVTLASADATDYSYEAGPDITIWSWAGTRMFDAEDTYLVTIA